VLQRVKDISYIFFVGKHLFILSGHLFTPGNAHECEEELLSFHTRLASKNQHFMA
jgi:hypothetical protein